ncbi:conserved hypothetical protein [Histoplasma capsulatum G186AR]|uniref:Uncharacterized protein n=2 Tax=Ajellomyces capsulatus TaxID=5037 RepID=C0NS63_AJECG|nr:uncharacterized protein HCBG_05993 [Histoplasma capsulatum G186AR]EEH05729.1 conserved hypothetical protein [Histoplasma capsulatum G186AR]KAG5300115.1 hypothetical protein I7I52_10653 [Histoplasma capsulatum]QSS67256.1 hypothetical protein I7I50_06274 [Histoplasma capsulatum G186AR]
MATMTSSAAAPTGSTLCGTPVMYEIPTLDAACAVPNNTQTIASMRDCCKHTNVTSYDGGCALVCLAVGQSVGELTKCLYSTGVPYNDVWCNMLPNATATGVSPTQTSTGTGMARPSSTQTPGTAASLYMPGYAQSGPTKLGLAVCLVVIPAFIGGMMF